MPQLISCGAAGASCSSLAGDGNSLDFENDNAACMGAHPLLYLYSDMQVIQPNE